jgi:hypothetical protein
MLTLLGLLIASYLRLNVNGEVVSPAERWSVDIPFSIYLGWITVAAVANITDLLYLIEWNGFGISAPIWAVTMIIVASILGLLMAITRREIAYLLVLVWSFVGIALKQASSASVAATAWLAAGFMLIAVVYSITRRQTA